MHLWAGIDAGKAPHHCVVIDAELYRGEGKTDATDAAVIADRVRAINRLQAELLEYFPALERAFNYSRSKAALLLPTKHRTPDGIRRAGEPAKPGSKPG